MTRRAPGLRSLLCTRHLVAVKRVASVGTVVGSPHGAIREVSNRRVVRSPRAQTNAAQRRAACACSSGPVADATSFALMPSRNGGSSQSNARLNRVSCAMTRATCVGATRRSITRQRPTRWTQTDCTAARDTLDGCWAMYASTLRRRAVKYPWPENSRAITMPYAAQHAGDEPP